VTHAGRPFVGLMVVGTEMASFTLMGLLADYFLGTMPGFTIGLTLLGLAVAFFHLVTISRALTAKANQPKTTNPPPNGSAT
jgi:F0F1-type ATP synthase assembly protein I